MAEYIEREALLSELQEEIDFETSMYTEEQNKYFNMGLKCAVRDVKSQPTADVVPKSEVENLKVLLEMTEKAYEGLRELYRTDTDALVEARIKTETEVAREIFEEIEERLASLEYHIQSPRKTVKIEELKAQVDWILHEVVPKTLAELKKKYIGESDVKRDTV